MAAEGVNTPEQLKEISKDQHYCCCREFSKSRCNGKISEQASPFTDDKYYCVVDGFGYPVLENIVYCPYCGNNLVGL